MEGWIGQGDGNQPTPASVQIVETHVPERHKSSNESSFIHNFIFLCLWPQLLQVVVITKTELT
jgi:hypothetical protein